MKRMNKTNILIVLSIITILAQCQYIPNCAYQYVFPNGSYIYICQECQKGFVVDYDFESCILASELPLAQYSFCKRLDRNRECDEALSTIQIDQNGLFVQEDPTIFDPRCAKIDTINKICISPKFPYTLDISKNRIQHSIFQFCKIKNDYTCIQNYETFYIEINYNGYFKLKNFINQNLIVPKVLYDFQIKCISPFTFKQEFYGCIPSKFNCLNNDGVKCICEQNQAIDTTGSNCSDEFQFCSLYGQAYKINYCITCKSGYYLDQNQCQPIQLNNKPACDSGYQLDLSSFNHLKKFLDNINPSINQDLSNPLYLLMLKYSIDFYMNEQYSYFKGVVPHHRFTCEVYQLSIYKCIKQVANICIQCENDEEVYYIQQQDGDIFSYQAICGQSQNIQNCKIISNYNCKVCRETFMMNQQKQCVQGTIQNCITYDDNQNCLFCQENFILISNQCVSMCPLGQKNSGINGQSCFQESNTCQISNQDENLGCKACLQGFYLNYNQQKGVCYYSKEYFCYIFKSDQVCETCQTNHILINNICYGQFQSLIGQTYGKKELSIDYYTNNQAVKNICPSSNNNMCLYENVKGKYLDWNFKHQDCNLPANESLTCKLCFQSNCIDKKYNCQQGYEWSEVFQECQIQCQNGMLLNFAYCSGNKVCDNLYQCSQNCILVSNLQNCYIDKIKSCSSQQYFSLQYNQCFVYCGNYKIALDQQNCSSTNLCLDEIKWNDESKQCEQRNFCSIQLSDNLVQYCPNCSLVTDLKYCSNNCVNISQPYYSFEFKQCFYYCGDGKINYQQSDCNNSQTCIDGYKWNYQLSRCEIRYCIIPDNYVKVCPNCSLTTISQNCSDNCSNQSQPYYSFESNECFFYCGEGKIKYAQSDCNNSQTCIDGYKWNYLLKRCEKGQCIIPDNQVKICPNCSLTTMFQECSDNCSNQSQPYYSFESNECFFYCGQGVIAKQEMDCQSSMICIDEYEFNSVGLCNPKYSSSSNSQINLNQPISIIGVIIAIAVTIALIFLVIFLIYRYKISPSIQKQYEEIINIKKDEMNKSLSHKFTKQQQQIESLKEIIRQQQQQNAQQNQSNPNLDEINSKNKDLELQGVSQETINIMMENDDKNQQDQTSQNQFQTVQI